MPVPSPFFSIVIPTLNEEHFLPKLLRCLLKQTFIHYEIIVVDGKSRDKTVVVAEEYAQKFIKDKKVFTIIPCNKSNVSVQRNAGAKHATGKYLVFLDADGYIGKNYLQEIYSHIKKEESLLITTWLEPDDDDFVNELLALLTNCAIEFSRHTQKALLPGANTIVERNIFTVIGEFDEQLKMSEDHDFAQRARKKGVTLRLLKRPIYTCSFRRFRAEGKATVLRKYAHSLTHVLFNKPITDKNAFEYPMGGAFYAREHTRPIRKRKLQNV